MISVPFQSYLATVQPSHENLLSPGGIAGVIVASILVILLILAVIAVLWYWNFKKKGIK